MYKQVTNHTPEMQEKIDRELSRKYRVRFPSFRRGYDPVRFWVRLRPELVGYRYVDRRIERIA